MSAADVEPHHFSHRASDHRKDRFRWPDQPAARVVLLGIPTRGVILAERLATNIAEYSGVEVGHGGLWTSRCTATT